MVFNGGDKKKKKATVWSPVEVVTEPIDAKVPFTENVQ